MFEIEVRESAWEPCDWAPVFPTRESAQAWVDARPDEPGIGWRVVGPLPEGWE